METLTSLTTLVNHSLPALSGSGVTYNAASNMFLTSGYTSAAGNTYYQGIQLSNRLVIVLDIGQGYAYTFLNGLKLYCFDGRQKKLIGSRFYHCCCLCSSFVQSEATEILTEFLLSQARLMRAQISEAQLQNFAREQVRVAANTRPQLTA